MYRDQIIKSIKPTFNPYSDNITRKFSKEYQIDENQCYENLITKMQTAQTNDKNTNNFMDKNNKYKCDNPNCTTKYDFFAIFNKQKENKACNFCSKFFCDQCSLACEYCLNTFCKFCIKIIYSEYKDINCCPNCG